MNAFGGNRRWAVVVALILVAFSAAPVSAQTPEGRTGPWLEIDQIFWFTAPDPHNVTLGNDYRPDLKNNPDFAYGEDRRPQCYYFRGGGPEADEVNAIYMTLSCRIGMVVGVISWASVGIGLMALAWGGVLWVVDSNAAGERMAALRNTVTGPMVGIILVFASYAIARMIYVTLKYNFDRYLAGEQFWRP